MVGPANAAIAFLAQTLFDLYILILLLRIILQWVGASANNPISRFIITLSQPLQPMRRFIPAYKGFDITSLIATIVLACLKLLLLSWLQTGIIPKFLGLMLWACADILIQVNNIFFYALIITVIISWINPTLNNAFTHLLYRITELLLHPIRRIMPVIAGFDLSPIPALILLQLVKILLIQPLGAFGIDLAFSGVS